jgi:hypothetical protein
MTKQSIDNGTSKKINRRGNGMKYVLVAVVSVLSTLGLVAGGFLLYQLLGQRTAMPTANNQINGSNSTSASSSNSQVTANNGSQSGLVQPALGNKARVELTAVRRIPGAADEVTVEMRLERLTDNVDRSDVISVGSTAARNPINSETYTAIDFFKRSSGAASLFEMRQGESVEGYVVLNVPAGVKVIDIYVDNTEPFKNVAIADANPVATVANHPPVVPSSTSPASSTLASAQQVPQTTTQVPSALNNSATIQPNQYVQNALGTKAQVELLAVKRIKDPELQTRDVVNVQMRIRRLTPENPSGMDMITVGSTTARNPDTSETYKGVDFTKHSTGTVSLVQMRPRSSVDAYVWLRVPEGANTLDIFIPETAAFKNVPISN